MQNLVVTMRHMGTRSDEVVKPLVDSDQNTYLSIFLENTICEKTLSVSSTSNSLTFVASFPLPPDDTLCDCGKSPSLRAQNTRPGGYKSAICIFASSVFLVAKNFVGKDHVQKNNIPRRIAKVKCLPIECLLEPPRHSSTFSRDALRRNIRLVHHCHSPRKATKLRYGYHAQNPATVEKQYHPNRRKKLLTLTPGDSNPHQ